MRNFGFGLLSLLTASLAQQGALACSPSEGAIYDDPKHQSVVAFAGSILTMETIPHGARGSCLNIGYHVDEPIRGNLSEHISISECRDDVSVERMKQYSVNMEESFGMKIGAYVFLAATLEGNQSRNFRLLKPSCWGVWHRRIGKYKAPTRREMIKRQRDLFSDR